MDTVTPVPGSCELVRHADVFPTPSGATWRVQDHGRAAAALEVDAATLVRVVEDLVAAAVRERCEGVMVKPLEGPSSMYVPKRASRCGVPQPHALWVHTLFPLTWLGKPFHSWMCGL